MSHRNAGLSEELIAIETCISRGWTVSLPYGGKAGYDFIYDTGNSLYRVQVKKIYQNKNVFNTWKVGFSKGNCAIYKTREERAYTRRDCDIIVGVCAVPRHIFVFPVEVVGLKRQATFSFNGDGHKDGQWVFDYEEAWPQ